METLQMIGKQEGNHLETVSIKALALKALQGNQEGNQRETGSFPDGNSEATGKPYTIIYSHLLKDSLLLVRTDEQAVILRQQGIEDVIYTAAEVHALKYKTPDEIRDFHAVKKVFPVARSC